MRRAITSCLLAMLGTVLATTVCAENVPNFHPMDQFEVRSFTPPPPVDRSASSYARCAGMYRHAVQVDGNNSFASEAESSLMARALALGGADKSDDLQTIRDDEIVLTEQREQQRQSISRKLYDMDEHEQAALSKEQLQEMMAPLEAQVVFVARCYGLVRELGKEGAKP